MKRRNNNKQFLVLGLGRFGDSLARSLCRMGHEVLAVDNDAEMVESIAPFVTQAVQADATDEEALRQLGAENFDAAVVAIGNIRDSILVTVLCKEAGIPHVTAKAVDELHAKVLRKVGADRVVFPEQDMGVRVAKSLVTPSILDMMSLTEEYQIAELIAPAQWYGRTLMEINVRRNYGLSVLAIQRGGEFIASPGADAMLQENDVLLVLGRQENIAAMEQQNGGTV
ncbi:MAG: TrkA family potassium uptake protein [Clostridia bacterium]|nr:TrkA family potassium uptake protein [Clostridia bacterium]